MNRLALAATVASLAMVSGAMAQQVPAIGGSTPPNTVTAQAGTASAANTPRAMVPDHMPPPLPTMSPSARLSARDAAAVRMSTQWRLRRCGTSMGADGILQINHGNCEPTLVCAVFKVCDVALEPGEGPTDLPSIGDPRFKSQIRFSSEGGRRVAHIVFKPDDAGLDTNFVLHTNQRTISLRLISTQNSYMPFLKLANPAFASTQDWRRAVADTSIGGGSTSGGANACETPPVVPPTAFEIDAPRAARSWAPLQVYTVAGQSGARTCIEFPADIGSIDLPSLVVLDAGGNQQLTTGRMVGRRMEIDQLVNKAELVVGVGSSQVAVKIQRKEYR